ncbi:addiction module protein [Geomonas sp. Red32]|uniref:addiction module protein n=1 Tax=Geomonas sp. Red32 TaxID=2912856 RepID=UPI00202CAD95|nr:addiction module protein [Geomonas sp. Red32]MCM0082378.1 addiction module protein [Geomonas sp. Red32]
MAKEIERIIAETMELERDERAHLAGKLLLSLDEPTPSELERLWLDEAERRLSDYREGRTKGVPADDVFRRAVAELT